MPDFDLGGSRAQNLTEQPPPDARTAHVLCDLDDESGDIGSEGEQARNPRSAHGSTLE
jgi:hypothetical protein